MTSPSKKPTELLSAAELLREKLAVIDHLDKEVIKRKAVFVPTTYGLPDLLRERDPDESEEAFRQWQDSALVQLIESRLHIHKDGRAFPIQVFPEIARFITDAFFRRENRLVAWKPRGGGGSVAAAIVVFTSMIYRHMSFLNMSGSAKQARAIYDHVCGFWADLPQLKRAFLKDGHPLKAEMAMRNGVKLEAVPASEKQARHQHIPGIVLDEAAQPEGSEVGEVMQTALEGTMSEEDHLIMVVSTFHEPAGFFANLWDHAYERGFARYKFNIFNSMRECTEGLDSATKTDPLALKFCRTQCPLTEKIEHADEFGNCVGEEYIGCNGAARKSKGFQTRKQVIDAKRINVGTDKFAVEFSCNRPKYKRVIYLPEILERQQVTNWTWDDNPDAVVGIDWGFSIQACVLLVIRGWCPDDEEKRGMCVVEAEFMSQELVGGTILRLRRWMREYGLRFDVYADAENHYNNAELEAAGFDVEPVNFGVWKEFGIGNVKRWLGRKALYFIAEHRTLLSQMKEYRRLPSGKPKNPGKDHGPDALLAAMMRFPFMDEFGGELGPNWTPGKDRKKELQGPDVVLI